MENLVSSIHRLSSAARILRAYGALKATPLKLRNGDWGARVAGTPSSGDTIRVTTRGGKSWESTVDKVVWTDGKVSIVSVESRSSSKSRPVSRPVSRSTSYAPKSYGGWGDGDDDADSVGICDECGRRARVTRCSDSSGLAGHCCPRCARQSQYSRSFG